MDSKLALGLTVFVSVEVAGHDAQTLARFTKKIASQGMPTMECALPFLTWGRTTLFTVA
jgi:hypothetical protein